MSTVCAHNEWDPLEEVIVGRIEGARIPTPDKGLLAVEYPDLTSPADVPTGPHSPQVVEETAEDLEMLVEAFTKQGIRVRRPDLHNHHQRYRSLDWETDGLANLCPRDSLLAIGDIMIETPMVLRARQYETLSYRRILMDYLESGTKWFAAPRPRLLDSVYLPLGGGSFGLDESEPIFDAANVIRIGRDVLYQISCSGNRMGARWLASVLGPAYRVHAIDNLYDSTHIDTTFTLVRPGLVVANSTRISRDNLPAIFRKWDVIYLDRVIDTGYVGHPVSSPWVGMNFMMINPHLAVVDRRQEPLIRELERHRVDVLPLVLRHARTLGGAFHCVTLDVRRRGELGSYCD